MEWGWVQQRAVSSTPSKEDKAKRGTSKEKARRWDGWGGDVRMDARGEVMCACCVCLFLLSLCCVVGRSMKRLLSVGLKRAHHCEPTNNAHQHKRKKEKERKTEPHSTNDERQSRWSEEANTNKTESIHAPHVRSIIAWSAHGVLHRMPTARAHFMSRLIVSRCVCDDSTTE